ncbi:hypothetical protein [Deinococcus multiflagellatus]|uniref:Uncharacterized protein n=1 Tax=Deinococcus multiflagellatus TaxID=1656887 RepID=A0ABW1ZT49_9DEIO|nr:hypothetical protein [Deinococcus multiflagellatus]MBZ9714993.1 hypothetical protein [Deinococcus multiflagellatus]
MDVLIDLCLRAAVMALAYPFTRGLLLVLTGLYAQGSGWPPAVGVLCLGAGVVCWLLPLWGLWRRSAEG